MVDDRGGAGGNIGAKAVADAKPDGYTVLTGQVSLMAVNPTLYASPGFDPLTNFVPITQINAAPLVLVVPSNSPLKSFADLAAQTKAPGGRITYADMAAAAALSVLDYLGEVNWSDFPAAKDWYSRVKSRPSFRPLLADRVRGLSSVSTYGDLDF